MKILAIYSNKGGVGKTTTAVNLSFLAAEAGLKTLVCDLDPQSSAELLLSGQAQVEGKREGIP